MDITIVSLALKRLTSWLANLKSSFAFLILLGLDTLPVGAVCTVVMLLPNHIEFSPRQIVDPYAISSSSMLRFTKADSIVLFDGTGLFSSQAESLMKLKRSIIKGLIED